MVQPVTIPRGHGFRCRTDRRAMPGRGHEGGGGCRGARCSMRRSDVARWLRADDREQPMRVVERFDGTGEAAVVDGFRRRDPEAVRELYREYGRLVYAVALRVLGRRELAEDAVQQTFVNAWQAADRFDATRDPASWLATIARRSAIDIYRRERRRPVSPLAEVTADDSALV